MPRTIAVNTWVWTSPLTDATLEPLARKAADLGYTALELPLENIGDWDPPRVRAVLDGLGLGAIVVGAMGPERSLLARAGDVVATREYLRACISAARVLGSPVVAGPFYAPTGITWRMGGEERAAVVDELRENLAPLAAEAQDAGITLAIEPLNRYETSVLNTVEQSLEALAPLFGRGVGLALDTYHLNIEEKKPADAIRAAGSAIAHVQVCGSDRGAVGDDHTDWMGIIQALDDAGYAGALGVESFTGENATIAVAASIWRPLAPSQDELAARSIAALRALGT
ncbi:MULTISPECIES: sugar phosphate isomerase/epimerase [unclassified Microbacterium]|uniref:sugar phosphate isomerase/epimerase family protein n=1 Tax=unclassified Microbacterium TaxID=2609290 RepID=UPI000EAA4864|nr:MULTISPECIES: sugar phosphate isomerase/epimerase [unclassified Microbacterium]MBT2486869.1 sugar phosphate isomerase/epimerase [Microbacterium sp. ISL-108]RKN64788.1 sugar phosphate isomerase/epimerase [Microbacterium sp. CGR2]